MEQGIPRWGRRGRWTQGSLALPVRAPQAELPIRIGAWGRPPSPSRTSDKQLGAGSRAAMADRATRPRYLECPGQHPHRPSLHGLPLLQMRRSTVSPGPHRTRRAAWRHGQREARAPRRAGLGATSQPPRSRPREDSEEAARKASRRPGEENSALFLEKKKIPVSFLQKYLFLPESEFGATSFKRCIIFC